jgi:hypothetical protein
LSPSFDQALSSIGDVGFFSDLEGHSVPVQAHSTCLEVSL